MMAQRMDLFALQEMVMASAVPKPMPALAAVPVTVDEESDRVSVLMIGSPVCWDCG